MKISYNWLQSHIEEALPIPEKLEELFTFHAFEVESLEKKEEDTVLDLNILPDRAADCLSHRGVAREVAGLLGLTLKKQEIETAMYPAGSFITLKSEKCRRYIAIKIEGISMQQTPDWLKEKLAAVGQQSINVVVDIANFIMLDLGQPVHVFDASAVDSGIVVREAKVGEKIITLSNEEKILPEGALVVADLLGPLAIAGIKGGKSAAVSEEIKDIIIEVANFDATSVGKTARTIGLLTDAAKRFENNVPVALTEIAAQAMITLLQKTVGGTVTWYEDKKTEAAPTRTISFTTATITSKLGTSVAAAEIATIFTHYGYQYTQTDESFVLTIPFWRPDITGTHDILEEIGRVRGYDTVAAVSLPEIFSVEENAQFALMMKTKRWLCNQGFREVETYVFGKKGELEVAYGAKGKNFVRSNLSDRLQEAFELNNRNAALFGQKTVQLFEIGIVFFNNREEMHVATISDGVLQEVLLDAFVATHPEIATTDVLFTPFTNGAHLFVPWSIYPFIVRDIAVWVATDSAAELETVIQEFSKKYCARPAVLFDTFTKEGRTSMAYRFVFQSNSKTLTDVEVEKDFKILLETIKENPSFEMR